MNKAKIIKQSVPGFTLLELLVVITIIAILAAIGLGNYTRTLSRGRDARRRADLKAVQNALEQYYVTHDSVYPSDGSGGLLTTDADFVALFSEGQAPQTREGGSYCDVNQSGGDQSPGRVNLTDYWCCEKLEQSKGNADLATGGVQPTPAAGTGGYFCIYNLQ
ncbi:MAG: type II secretion system protein [bacterium]|nr:type II secretion system protein [bacterium]